MICHSRRKQFFIKLIKFTIIIGLSGFVIYSIITHYKKHKEKRKFNDWASKQLVKKSEIAEWNQQQDRDGVEYVPLTVNVPHWLSMFTDFALLVSLPNYGEPGQYGIPVLLENLSPDEQLKNQTGYDTHAFNELVSDRISVRRHLPDVRPIGCDIEKYSRKLPKTSIIVCFHNEAKSTLYRTIHSILDRTSPSLLEEIILVDDFSDMPHLKKELEDYTKTMEKVKILRTTKREGLIRARLFGASKANGPVLTFLDSHCECAPGWLEPLLQRIYDNPNAVVSPVIDIVDENTFQYMFRAKDEIAVGGFSWDLQFDWHSIPELEKFRRNNDWDPVRTPTVAGGLFSIGREFFEKIGRYDEGFDIWGAENLELSFKTWMCGGTLEIIPCSHVGHVFRPRTPYIWKPGENVFQRNCIRLAEVWMDEYKHLFYRRLGINAYAAVAKKTYGDVSSRKELRNSLNCKSFDWYLKNIFPEQYVPKDVIAEGEFRNLGGGFGSCLDAPTKQDDFGVPVSMYECHLQGGNQYFLYSQLGEIRRDNACLDYTGTDIVIALCHGSMGNQMWTYNPDTHFIIHSTGQCLAMTPDKLRVTMEPCNGDPRQTWGLQSYKEPTAFEIII